MFTTSNTVHRTFLEIGPFVRLTRPDPFFQTILTVLRHQRCRLFDFNLFSRHPSLSWKAFLLFPHNYVLAALSQEPWNHFPPNTNIHKQSGDILCLAENPDTLPPSAFYPKL